MRAADPATLRALIAAIPEDRLRELVLELLLTGPTAAWSSPSRMRGGWPVKGACSKMDY